LRFRVLEAWGQPDKFIKELVLNLLRVLGLDYGKIFLEGTHLLPFFYWGLGLRRLAGFAHVIDRFNCLYHR
jgi:hypothetical protein